ncbi:hypothetical protein Nepgr_032321 [Nepenthes gracilis]|uniref:non-specific serine/threonine protein kinase n=1 Tax=Nepenthes gracilis TaxID=150966 RepID=A0AAD3Y5Y4_NEPGR|nr:hypothetical protein Nepgr_032321 [Nepenthes gracilis]
MVNALEYLRFYYDPPLFHRDIKSSNILFYENYAAKVADFGLVHVSNKVYICSEPINANIQGTQGYTNPEYVVTRELNENNDVHSYGIVLPELVAARQTIKDNENLVEWTQEFMGSESRLPKLVDPCLGDSFDYNQLETIICLQGDRMLGSLTIATLY